MTDLTLKLTYAGLLIACFIRRRKLRKRGPSHNHVFFLQRSSPVARKGQITFTNTRVPPRLGRDCTRMRGFLQLKGLSLLCYGIGRRGIRNSFGVLSTSAALAGFFSCHARRNDLDRMLYRPKGITLDRTYTHHLFKKGRTMKGRIRTRFHFKRIHPCRITTILGGHRRSLLRFSVLVTRSPSFF